uniref:Uncharacterized protein n=1 Tax=Anguilla anguilla TaxID=7936 RepID=A0A0E9R8S0_ANGAN
MRASWPQEEKGTACIAVANFTSSLGTQ